MKDMLKNIINKTYFKVAIINLVIFGIANILFNIKYEQVDDMIIYSLYSGLDSTYNIHGIYIYPLICLVLSNLYKICSIINWHTVLLLSMQFICFTVIGTILLKNKSSPFMGRFLWLKKPVISRGCYAHTPLPSAPQL